MSLFPTPVVICPLLYRGTDVMLLSWTLYSKHCTCFCASKYGKIQKKKQHKTVEHCASSPTEPVFDFCLYLLCKRNLLVHTIWECIWTASLYSMYVCVSLSTSNKLTWYYGRLSHFGFPFICREWQVGLGFPKWGGLSSLAIWVFVLYSVSLFYVGCVFVTTLNTHNNVM